MIAASEVQNRIEAFRKRYRDLSYSDGQYWLLCMAAFPIAITPDLLYRLWNNFRQVLSDAYTIERVAVADVLLWPGWHETATDVFELDEEVRTELITQLKQLNEQRKDVKPGSDLIQELAQFLYQYTTHAINGTQGSLLQQAQLLGVQATLAPRLAARQVQNELAAQILAGNESEILRIRNLVGALAGLHSDFEPLLSVTKGLKAYLLGMGQGVWQRQFVRPNEAEDGQVLGMAIDEYLTEGDFYLEVPLPNGMVGQLTLPELAKPEPPKRMFLLCVGIDEYKGMPLEGCLNDAEILLEVLPNYFNGDSQEVIKKKLINESATKQAILNTLDGFLKQAGSQDIIVFTFSGHGQNAKQRAIENTIATYGFSSEVYNQSMKEPERMASCVISETEFRNLVVTAGGNDPHVLVISDTHNGSPNWLDLSNPKHIIIAAGSNWSSVIEREYENKQHGAFTAALVTALRTTHASQTYISLIRHIYGQMVDYEQTPQLFGSPEAIKRPFLSTTNSLQLYMQEMARKLSGTMTSNPLGPDYEEDNSKDGFEWLLPTALRSYAGIMNDTITSSEAFAEQNKKIVNLLEQAVTTKKAENGLSTINIGCPAGLNQMKTHFSQLDNLFINKMSKISNDFYPKTR